MPSGAKKRRAAKRKKQEEALAKQTDEFTSVSILKLSIPIEKLVQGADLREANNTTGVPDNYTAASVDENAIQENNEVPLLEVTSNKDNAVSKGEPLVESGENLKGNESYGVVYNDTIKETELLTVPPEHKFVQVHDLLSDAPKPEEMLEKLYDLLSVDDTTQDYDKNTGELPVGSRGEADDVEVLASSVGKELEEVKRLIGENEVSMVKVTTNEDNEMSKDETVLSHNAGCIIESTSKCHELISVGSPEGKVDTAPLVPMIVMSKDSTNEAENTLKLNELLSVVPPEEIPETTLMLSNVCKEIESTSMFHYQSIEAAEGTKDTAQPVSDKDGVCSSKGGITSCFSPFIINEQEMQAVPTSTVSSATENQVYFACPVHCNSKCSFPKWLRGQSDVEVTARMESLKLSVEELKGAVHTLEEDLQKTLDKLTTISY
ncbi:hypothetical protein RND71_004735 [Anisodus tanguticus]|uniref:Uncharacterized protein n=1 Tax=Anisodus tanguticus TaxID=243964 RepID=A0AAE1SR36_9SOLA|nr:hypothetical protein RND71_004735 [Anisodus tanguticus]